MPGHVQLTSCLEETVLQTCSDCRTGRYDVIIHKSHKPALLERSAKGDALEVLTLGPDNMPSECHMAQASASVTVLWIAYEQQHLSSAACCMLQLETSLTS